MKEMIREYFNQMLEDGIDIEGAKDNLDDLIEEVIQEIEE